MTQMMMSGITARLEFSKLSRTVFEATGRTPSAEQSVREGHVWIMKSDNGAKICEVSRGGQISQEHSADDVPDFGLVDRIADLRRFGWSQQMIHCYLLGTPLRVDAVRHAQAAFRLAVLHTQVERRRLAMSPLLRVRHHRR